MVRRKLVEHDLELLAILPYCKKFLYLNMACLKDVYLTLRIKHVHVSQAQQLLKPCLIAHTTYRKD